MAARPRLQPRAQQQHPRRRFRRLSLFPGTGVAYGCTQVASNPFVCGGGGVPYNIKAITQDKHITRSASVSTPTSGSQTVGVAARRRLSAVRQPEGRRYHWLRIGTARRLHRPIAEDGRGHGYQLEAALNYAVNQNVSFAVGGRYWHMETKGNTHFEGNVVASPPRRSRWSGKPIFTACLCRARSSSARTDSPSQLCRIAGFGPPR